MDVHDPKRRCCHLLVEFDEGRSLFDLMNLQEALESVLGVPVDVVSAGGLDDIRDTAGQLAEIEAPLVAVNPKALCVDYSAGAGRELVADRFDGETDLAADELVSF